MFKQEIRGPIWALFWISLGGWLIHYRSHPAGNTPFNWIPLILGAVTTIAVPIMFNYRRTVAWAFMINMVAVVIGTITMAYFSICRWQIPNPLWTMAVDTSTTTIARTIFSEVVIKSTFADIAILWAKVPLGWIILRHFRPQGAAGGRS